MSKMIQVRNVPDTLHRRLKVRAALAGLSLSDYILQEMKLAAQRPTYDEFLERLGTRTQVRTRETAAQAVRAEREGR
jgi:plasmid stability protein